MKNLINRVKNFGKKVVADVKAMSHTTEIILAIVLVVAIIGAFFAPAITDWFANVMKDLGTHTTDLFAFAPKAPVVGG